MRTKKDLNKVSLELTETLNSLCKEESVLNRSGVFEILNPIYSYPQKILMPLRKLGILSVSKGIYHFKKQSNPIFWKKIYNMLHNIENGTKIVKRANKIDDYTYYLNTTDGRVFII